MSDIDPKLRWRQAMQLGTRPDSGRPDCPDADTLALLIAQPEAAPVELLSHVERCSACAAELRSLNELPDLEAMIATMARRRRRTSAWIPLAATAVLAVTVGLSAILQPEPTLPDNLAVRSASALDAFPAEGAVLAKAPETIAWSTQEGQSYRLMLYDEAAHRLWTSKAISAGEVTLPDDLRGELQPGRYYWQVQIVGSGMLGGPFSFEIEQSRDRDR